MCTWAFFTYLNSSFRDTNYMIRTMELGSRYLTLSCCSPNKNHTSEAAAIHRNGISIILKAIPIVLGVQFLSNLWHSGKKKQPSHIPHHCTCTGSSLSFCFCFLALKQKHGGLNFTLKNIYCIFHIHMKPLKT